MPIDTPYNRSVTNQYNQLLRNKVAHEEATYQTVMPSPAGKYVNGYEPVMVGSGVGLYKKEKACPKGHAVCTCGSGSAHGISATICGSGSAHGQYDRVVGSGNLGLEPSVRVELALGAGMRGNATSKHGCLDMYESYAHGGMSFADKVKKSGLQNPYNQQPRICPMDMSESSIACREGSRPPRRNAPRMPKKQDPTLFNQGGKRRVDPNERRRDTSFDKPQDGTLSHKGGRRHGNKGQAYNRLLAEEHGNKNKALRQLGNGSAHGGKKGFKNPLSSKPPAKQPKKGNKAPPKKEEPSMYTLENLEKGINTAEKVGNVVGKVVPMFEGAYNYGKKLFGFAKGEGSAHGKAHGKSRCEIVRQVMNKMGCSMIEASKHVKANGLY